MNNIILGTEKFHLRSCVIGPQSLSGQCFEKDEGARHLCYCMTDECNADKASKLYNIAKMKSTLNIANQRDVSFVVTIIISIFSFYFF